MLKICKGDRLFYFLWVQYAEFLKQKLTDHLASHYNGKVKVVRAERREGLIRTRLLGAKHATGEVIIFLDSHIEASINWLPPLLGRCCKLHIPSLFSLCVKFMCVIIDLILIALVIPMT